MAAKKSEQRLRWERCRMNNDLISKSALLELAHNHVGGTVDCNDIARFPAVDAVEVVRCKDCKHGMFTKFRKGEPELITCTHKNMFPLRVTLEFYCAYGAKMDAEVEG